MTIEQYLKHDGNQATSELQIGEVHCESQNPVLGNSSLTKEDLKIYFMIAFLELSTASHSLYQQIEIAQLSSRDSEVV